MSTTQDRLEESQEQDERRDWRVTLTPANDPDFFIHGTIAILYGDEQAAVDALEIIAGWIGALGYVPDLGMDWRNQAGCAIVSRGGRRMFRVRCDTFERETENGFTTGAGFLRVEEAL